jgi:putative membrane protein
LPADWLTQWNLDPVLIAALAVTASLHITALLRDDGDHRAKRVGLAASAWVLLAVLFVSPLCALTSALFSARVTHHVILIAFAAPMLVASMPQRWRMFNFNRIAAFGVVAAVVHMVLLWLWHAPAPYVAALADSRLFWVMELSLLLSATWLWLSVLAPSSTLGATLGVLLGTIVQMGLLGAVITFARVPLYSAHMAVTEPWGLSALQDQQLAGLIMWVPASWPYLVAALALLARRMQRAVTADEAMP